VRLKYSLRSQLPRVDSGHPPTGSTVIESISLAKVDIAPTCYQNGRLVMLHTRVLPIFRHLPKVGHESLLQFGQKTFHVNLSAITGKLCSITGWGKKHLEEGAA